MDITCHKCKISKPASNFYRNRSKRGGYGKYCKECLRLEYRERRIRNYKTFNEKEKKYYAKNRERVLEKRRNFMLIPENKLKEVARHKVCHAIKKGKLIRPFNCSVCNKEGKTEAHHSDYNKPLDVVWLCKTCHRRLHFGKQPCRPII